MCMLKGVCCKFTVHMFIYFLAGCRPGVGVVPRAHR